MKAAPPDSPGRESVDIPLGGIYPKLSQRRNCMKTHETAAREGGALPMNVEQPYLDPESAKGLMDRLARIEGHVRSVSRMVEEHRCADEILLQVSAVKAALNQVSSRILDRELAACVESCMDGDPDQRLKKVTRVLSTLLKQS